MQTQTQDRVVETPEHQWISSVCDVGLPLEQLQSLGEAELAVADHIRKNYRRCRVMSEFDTLLPLEMNKLGNKGNKAMSSEGIENYLFELWNHQPVEVLLGNRNLPPLINPRAIDPRTVVVLNLTSDISGNLGGICFIVGSFAFYEEYDAPTLGSVLFAVGSLLFFIGSCANFIKNDAWSAKDMGLTLNAWLYLFANFLFIVGSVAFVPAVEEELGGTDLGISLFIIGSVIFIVAPLYDMYRAHNLRESAQISYLSFVIETTIAILYIGGSCLFVVGSVYFFPALYEEFAVTLFVVGSCCFFAATISSPLANFFRYVSRVTQVEKNEKVVKLAEATDQGVVEVLLGNRNLPPLINPRAIDPRTVVVLNLTSDISGNLGGICFIVGSFAFYEEYDAPTLGSVLFAVGSLLFFIGSCANFIKNDAWSAKDMGLTLNAWLYLFANFLFIVGSVAFVPAVEEELGGTDLGISLFIIGSVIFIVAPLYDMYRAHNLRESAQISYLSFVIETTIAILYIGGSCLFVVGSVYFFPALYEEFAVTLFVVGSCCFFAATISSPLANCWRYLNRENNKKLEAITAHLIRKRGSVKSKGRSDSSEEGGVRDIEYNAFFARGAGELSVSNRNPQTPRGKNVAKLKTNNISLFSGRDCEKPQTSIAYTEETVSPLTVTSNMTCLSQLRHSRGDIEMQLAARKSEGCDQSLRFGGFSLRSVFFTARLQIIDDYA